ncbi:MAG: PKD domain-containing protein [Bacteroidota bacterium]
MKTSFVYWSLINLLLLSLTLGSISVLKAQVNVEEPAETGLPSDPRLYLSQIQGPAPLQLSFFAIPQQSVLPDQISLRWDFGDGTETSQPNGSHLFAFPGSYRVTLRICLGDSCRTEQQMVVVQNPFMPFSDHAGLLDALERPISLVQLSQIRNQPEEYQKAITFLAEIGASFIGRAESIWGTPNVSSVNFNYQSSIARPLTDLEEAYLAKDRKTGPILQAAIYEHLNPFTVDQNIATKEILNLFYEEKTTSDRFFDCELMMYPPDYNPTDLSPLNGIDNSTLCCVPDISQPETRAYFYFLGKLYIDAGYQSIHLGQVNFMLDNDPGHLLYWDLLTKLRNYAFSQGRYVLFDAHVDIGPENSFDPYVSEKVKAYADSLMAVHEFTAPYQIRAELGLELDHNFEQLHEELEELQLLFDFHSSPTWARESLIIDGECQAEIVPGHHKAIYQRSIGGISPQLGPVKELPFITELDNGVVQPNVCLENDGRDYELWGTDETGWYLSRSACYQAEFIQYAYNRVKELDEQGRWQPIVSRGCFDADGNHKFTNTTCAAWNQPELREAILDTWYPPEIEGAEEVCYSGSSFRLVETVSGRDVRWRAAPDSLFSGAVSGPGSTAFLRAAGPGKGKIRFTIVGNCEAKIVEKEILVGPLPIPNRIEGPESVELGQLANYRIGKVSEFGNPRLVWSFPDCDLGEACWEIVDQNEDGTQVQVRVGAKSGYVRLTSVNHCGEGAASNLLVTVRGNNVSIGRRVATSPWFRLSPNPADKQLTITLNDQSLPGTFVMMDINGRLLQKGLLDAPLNRVSVAGLPNGVYIFRLQQGARSVQELVQVQH